MVYLCWLICLAVLFVQGISNVANESFEVAVSNFVFLHLGLKVGTKSLIVNRKVVYVDFSGRVTANVLELCLVRFETFSYRNITDKDTMFVAICKAKIIVPAKRPLLQMLCCPPALGKGAVIGCSGHIVAVSLLVNIGFCSRSTYKIYNESNNIK